MACSTLSLSAGIVWPGRLRSSLPDFLRTCAGIAGPDGRPETARQRNSVLRRSFMMLANWHGVRLTYPDPAVSLSVRSLEKYRWDAAAIRQRGDMVILSQPSMGWVWPETISSRSNGMRKALASGSWHDLRNEMPLCFPAGPRDGTGRHRISADTPSASGAGGTAPMSSILTLKRPLCCSIYPIEVNCDLVDRRRSR